MEHNLYNLFQKTTVYLAAYLEKVLPSLFDDWWKQAVVNNLSFQQRRRLELNSSKTGVDMSSRPDVYVSPEEYLALERKAEYKSEYIDGQIFALAGGSGRHNLIVANIIASLHGQLVERPCRVYASDLKVRAPKPKYFFYPDDSVICGETKFHDEYMDVVLNPVLIIEVLSDTTAALDREKKFQYYQRLNTLAEYLLVAQDELVVEHYVRQADGSWIYRKTSGLEERVVLPSIGCEPTLHSIYDKTT